MMVGLFGPSVRAVIVAFGSVLLLPVVHRPNGEPLPVVMMNQHLPCARVAVLPEEPEAITAWPGPRQMVLPREGEVQNYDGHPGRQPDFDLAMRTVFLFTAMPFTHGSLLTPSGAPHGDGMRPTGHPIPAPVGGFDCGVGFGQAVEAPANRGRLSGVSALLLHLSRACRGFSASLDASPGGSVFRTEGSLKSLLVNRAISRGRRAVPAWCGWPWRGESRLALHSSALCWWPVPLPYPAGRWGLSPADKQKPLGGSLLPSQVGLWGDPGRRPPPRGVPRISRLACGQASVACIRPFPYSIAGPPSCQVGY